MKTSYVLFGLVVLLFGVGIFAYSEVDYQNKMDRLYDLRLEQIELMDLAEQKYNETSDPKYLNILLELESLYAETFSLEVMHGETKFLGNAAGVIFVLAGICLLIYGFAVSSGSAKSERLEEAPSHIHACMLH